MKSLTRYLPDNLLSEADSRTMLRGCVLFSSILACLSICGCSVWKVNKKIPWVEDEQEIAVARIVPMWSDTVLYETDQPGIRGFAARVYFYPSESTEPLQVEGSLTIYAFDSENYDRHHTKPEKKFVFKADQLQQHYSKTKLGHSYSIWLPWDKVGGPTRQITLITKFRDANGSTVISDPARKLLPGISVEMDEPDRLELAPGGLSEPNAYPVSQASFTQGGNGRRKESRAALTLDLPPSFSRGLQSRGSHAQRIRSRFEAGRLKEPNSQSDRSEAGYEEARLNRQSESTHSPTTDSFPQELNFDAVQSAADQVLTEKPVAKAVNGQVQLEELPVRQRLQDRFESRKRLARNWPKESRAFLPSQNQQRRSERPYAFPPIQ